MANKTVSTTYNQPTTPNGAIGERLTILIRPDSTLEGWYEYTNPATGLTYSHPVALLPAAASSPDVNARAALMAARLAVWGP